MNKLTKKRVLINVVSFIFGILLTICSYFLKSSFPYILGLIAIAIWWEFLGGKKYYEMDEVDIKATYKSGYYAFMTLLIGQASIMFTFLGNEELSIKYLSYLLLITIVQFFIVLQYYMRNPHKLDK